MVITSPDWRRGRSVAAVFLALVLTLGVSIGPYGPQPVDADPSRTCDKGGTNIFSGVRKQAPDDTYVYGIRAVVDKQRVLLCSRTLPDTFSASSWWVMLWQPDTKDDIQYGFWNCQNGCHWWNPDLATAGKTVEFWERYNGNFGGHYRVNLGNPADGYRYALVLNYTCPQGQRCRFTMTRNGYIRAVSYEDGWRDWPLNGLQAAMFSETWNRGDQNGGVGTNRVWLQRGGWRTSRTPNGGWVHTGFSSPCQYGLPSPNPAEYGCLDRYVNVPNDSVGTWTRDR